jgi:hypothetical protein
MRLRLAIFVCVAVIGWAGAASAQCMRPEHNQNAQGRLTIGRFTDAADRPERAYILQLSAPACLDGADDQDPVKHTRRIHVYSADGALQRKMRSLVGRNVVVSGTPFSAHTAHHHAPIVMGVDVIEAR